jgi:hypothetical protein
LIGFYVNSTNAGTLVLKDGGSSGTAIAGTITPAIGWHFFPVNFGSGGNWSLGICNSGCRFNDVQSLSRV